jgi:hypothetical protein
MLRKVIQAICPTFIIASGRMAQQQFILASGTYTPLRWGPMVGCAGKGPVFGVAHLKFCAPLCSKLNKI